MACRPRRGLALSSKGVSQMPAVIGTWRENWKHVLTRHSAQLTAIYDLICRYHDTYRHPSMEELILSVPHALGEIPGYRSVQSWPNYSDPGVYIMLDESKRKVLYVGQAEKLGY